MRRRNFVFDMMLYGFQICILYLVQFIQFKALFLDKMSDILPIT